MLTTHLLTITSKLPIHLMNALLAWAQSLGRKFNFLGWVVGLRTRAWSSAIIILDY